MEFLNYVVHNAPAILELTGEHLQLALMGVFYALLVGVPLGIFISRHPRWVGPVLWITNAIQTIPSLAFIGFVMIFLGLSRETGVTVLFFYSLMPIVRNTYTGVVAVDGGIIEAARGMGMTSWQILRMVQLPLALGIMLVGVRVAVVTAVGTASMMSLAGAGGLGELIFAGIDRVNTKMILGGALPAAMLAVFAEVGIGALERKLTPGGLQPTR